MTTWTCAYRLVLDPTPAQQRALLSHTGAARVAHNWALALVKATVAPWWADNSKEAYNSGLDAVARALGNWPTSRSGKRAGKLVGFPRFKSRHRSVPSVRFTTGTIRVDPDRHHAVLPRLGPIKTHKSTHKLTRRIDAGTARILSATVRRDGGRWFCSFTVEVKRAQRTPRRPDATVGVDLGVKTFAVLSDAPAVPNPHHLTGGLRRIGRRNRTMARRAGPYDPATRRRREPSNRWRRAQRAVAAAHTSVGNLRRDGLHKLTTRIA